MFILSACACSEDCEQHADTCVLGSFAFFCSSRDDAGVELTTDDTSKAPLIR